MHRFKSHTEKHLKNDKKMKNTLLFSLLLAVTAISAHAQKTAEVNLSVTLHAIQTIEINSSKSVNLDYVLKEHYTNGVSSDQLDHLRIYSTGAFAVNVRSTNSKLTNPNSNVVTTDIAAKDIKITPTIGSSELKGSVLKTVRLNVEPQLLISNSKGGFDKKFNINYAAAGADKYVNKYFKDESPTIYSTTVVYTIEVQ